MDRTVRKNVSVANMGHVTLQLEIVSAILVSIYDLILLNIFDKNI